MARRYVAADNTPKRFTLLVCEMPGTPSFREYIAQAFPEHAYVVLGASRQDAADAVAQHQPDAILAPNAPPFRKLFRALEQNPERAPMRILIPTPDAPLSETSPTDAVLTSDSTSWGVQLLPLLRMRAQIMALRTENTRLRENKGGSYPARQTDIDLELFKRYIFNNVSHELRTPLLQMKAALAMLAQDPANSTLIDLAIKATTRLEENVQNILQIAQSTKINLDATFLSDAVELALRNLKNSWRHSANLHRVIIEFDANLPAVLADKRAIGSVLTHLIENGLKFSEGPVYVRARCEDDLIRVSVEDSGIGIAPEMHEAIFGEFIQGDPSSTRRFDGMGIGLSIVRIILDRHEASITVESEPGKGARFSFPLRIIPMETPDS